MAEYTVQDLYYGEKYGIMGRVALEFMHREPHEDEQTEIEMAFIRHTILALRRMEQEGDTVAGV